MKLKQIVTIALGLFILTFTGTVVASVFIKPENTATTVPIEESNDDFASTEPLSVGSAVDPTVQTFETEITVNPDGTTSSSGTTSNTSGGSTNTGGSSGGATQPTPTCGNGGTCTTNQVATHNKRTDCWVIISSKVYNITQFASSEEHRKPASTFTDKTCGTDITQYFYGEKTLAGVGNNDHRNSERAMSLISMFYIANLQ